MMEVLCQALVTFFLSDIFGVSALFSCGAKVISSSDSGEHFTRVSPPGPIERASIKVTLLIFDALLLFVS